jgi:hypothetical protein
VTLFEAQITLKRLQTLLFGRRRRSTAASGAAKASEGEGGPRDEAGLGEVCGSNAARGADVGAESGWGCC